MKFNLNLKKWLAIAPFVVVAVALYVLVPNWLDRPTSQSQFKKAALDGGVKLPAGHTPTNLANADGTIHYLYDNFSSYGANTKLLDGFSNTDGLTTTNASHIAISNQAYEGASSLHVTARHNDDNATTVSRSFNQPQDLSRWSSSGYITMWLKSPGTRGISGASIQLGTATGDYRQLNTLPNLQTDYPDAYNKNDPFVDLPYPETTSSSEWTDFSIKAGWNFLPWRLDPAFYADHGTPDLTKITWYKLIFNTTAEAQGQQLLLDDLRIQDGLQKQHNPTNGNWYPPLGMPQYGVYDINDTGSQGHNLKLQNVRQTQYPSNGDHGRLLSKYGTPNNFAMRAQFEINNLGADGGDLTNTWLRIFYDFDPEYDPGHDWFGSYFSFDYKQMGLISVIPLQRFAVQTQEPLESKKQATFRKGFALKPNTRYEYDLTVKGQSAKGTIYQVKNNQLYARSTVEYTFLRPRNNKHYPLGIEITGNVKTTIYEIEVTQL